MTLRKKLIPALCFATTLLLAACGGGGTNGANGAAGNSPAGGTTQTGIAACDDYLAKVEKCILNNPNVPDQAKTTYRTSQEQSRTAWKAAAANPTAKAQAEASCKQAMDAAKPAFDMYCK